MNKMRTTLTLEEIKVFILDDKSYSKDKSGLECMYIAGMLVRKAGGLFYHVGSREFLGLDAAAKAVLAWIII